MSSIHHLTGRWMSSTFLRLWLIISALVAVPALLAIVGYLWFQLSAKSQKASNDNLNPIESVEDQEVADHQHSYRLRTLRIPDKLSLAGEPVPVHSRDIRERLDKELHVNTYWQSNTFLMLKRGSRWLPRMKEILKEEGLPEDLVYIPVIESGLSNVVSPAGAAGFWQFMEATAEEMGLTVNNEVDERYDPIKATHAACKYFHNVKGRNYSNWANVIASYNVGIGNLDRNIEHQLQTHYYDLDINSETNRYLFRIIAMKLIFNQPELHGFYLDERAKYPEEATFTVELEKSIPSLTFFAKEIGLSYRLLKRYNPWLRSYRLTVPPGESYTLTLPKVAVVNGVEFVVKKPAKDLLER